MKKIILSIAVLGTIAFTGCSNDDEDSSDSSSTCKTCDITVGTITNTTEYCDNGDGTVDVTVQGFTTTVDLGESTYSQYITAIELTSTCN